MDIRVLCERATTIPSLEAETALHVLMDHYVMVKRLTPFTEGNPDFILGRMLALTFSFAWFDLTNTMLYRVPKKHRRLPLRVWHGQIIGLTYEPSDY